ncbi:MAG: type II secretion system protein [Patescibacteria group bacterium]
MRGNHRRRAFTLIEILIVVVLLGILVGIVVLVIDVPMQRKRARQAVGRENIGKACSAFTGCLVTSQTGDLEECSSWIQIGVAEPLDPAGAIYTMDSNGPSISIDGCLISCNNQGMLSLADEVGGICLIR